MDGNWKNNGGYDEKAKHIYLKRFSEGNMLLDKIFKMFSFDKR